MSLFQLMPEYLEDFKIFNKGIIPFWPVGIAFKSNPNFCCFFFHGILLTVRSQNGLVSLVRHALQNMSHSVFLTENGNY